MTQERHFDSEISLHWVRLEKERVPSLRDSGGRLLYPFNEYLDTLSSILHEKETPARTIKSQLDAATYALKSFAQFLASRKKDLSEVDDDTIVAYRKHAFKQVKASHISRDDDLAARRTVNVKLKEIYKFLSECQRAYRLDPTTIGFSDCRVCSTLPLKLEGAARGAGLEEGQLYPKCFERIGNKSAGDTRQYWATDKDVDALEDYFWGRNRETHTALRNILMMRLGEQLAWRISSINSLEVSQFSEEELHRQRENDAFTVAPPFQKRGYTDSFTVRWELAREVARFISEERAGHLWKLGCTERDAGRRVFLSTRGTPLTDHYAIELLADAFKAIAPGRNTKGRGSHSLRRRSAKERMRDEISFRRAQGLSMAQEDVERAVQPFLGHSSVLSQRAYSQAITELRTSSQLERLQKHLLQRQIANDSLRMTLKERDERIAELEAQVNGTDRKKGKTRTKRTITSRS
jgi:integrase